MRTKIQINQRVEPELLERIEARATKVGCTRNEWVIRALQWALAQPETERPKTIKERV